MIITGNNVSKEFIRQGKGTNRFVAVKQTQIRIEEGKLTLLTGRSGSGKSTLLNMLAGLLAPTSGTVMYGDDDIYSLDDETIVVTVNVTNATGKVTITINGTDVDITESVDSL